MTVKKKPHLNILIFHGDTKGDTGLLGNTVCHCNIDISINI